MIETSTPGDAMPANGEVIEAHVADIPQLFNPIDPAPFRARDLDPKVEEFIVDWAREVPHDTPVGLVVRVDRQSGAADEAAFVRDAVHAFFAARASASRLRLRRLFHVGRISLVIGLAVLALLLATAQYMSHRASGSALAEVLRESLLIGGWVAMWRPLEIFLYDWWPIRAEAKLFDRLAVMPVQVSDAPAFAGQDDRQHGSPERAASDRSS